NKSIPMDSDSLVLWRRPFTTLEYFFRELLILISTGLQRLLAYRLLALSTIVLAASTVVSYYISGPHQAYVH
ncbi:vacuole membrane protein 1-like, partial [Ostrinia furnacalis]